jgi:quercetin dioxygenase-like cupin family protein
MVGYAYDYATERYTGWHQYPRAQLLHATTGIMRVATATALFIVPPGTGLWVPAHTEHVTRVPERAGDARAVPARGRGPRGT